MHLGEGALDFNKKSDKNLGKQKQEFVGTLFIHLKPFTLREAKLNMLSFYCWKIKTQFSLRVMKTAASFKHRQAIKTTQ